ncbi:MAG: hypothetical protein K9M07_02575 [Simkaniaceae bacterium]|nr:hypothetical protein [Simkaniaceae bacterium]
MSKAKTLYPKRIAVLSATGIGDALLMMIAAHQLAKAGHDVTLFHDQHAQFASLFDSPVHFESYPISFDPLISFDRIILENDHSKRAHDLAAMRNQCNEFIILCHKPSKLFQTGDFLFDPKKSVAENIRQSLKKWIDAPTLDNGLKSFSHYRQYPKRVAIHPGSNDSKRNWNLTSFIAISKQLKQWDFDPIFTLGANDDLLYRQIKSYNVPIKVFPSLLDLAEYYVSSGFFIGNDSGPGHLASNLKIPTLTISGNSAHVAKWRPGWHIGEVVTPLIPLPNFKGLHLALRDAYWQHWIGKHRVLKAFKKLSQSKL